MWHLIRESDRVSGRFIKVSAISARLSIIRIIGPQLIHNSCQRQRRKYVLVSCKNKHIPFLLFIEAIIRIHCDSEHIVILQKMMPQQNWLFDTFLIGEIFTNHQWSLDQHKVWGWQVISWHHFLLSSAHW